MNVKVFSADYLDDLVRQASISPRRRQHRNIHADYQDPCQRLFNAIEPDSYLRPHRHGTAQGAETMIAVRGVMKLVIFGNDGKIEGVYVFGAAGAGGVVGAKKVAVGVETPPGRWHTVIAIEAGSVLLEMKAGPFDPSVPKFPAPWAPEEGTPEGEMYLERLLSEIRVNW